VACLLAVPSICCLICLFFLFVVVQGMVHRSHYQALGWCVLVMLLALDCLRAQFGRALFRFFHPTYTSWGPDDFVTHLYRKVRFLFCAAPLFRAGLV
jgi:hypothetical protein